MPNFIDITNKRFGRWLVLRRTNDNKHRQPQFLCRCDCGTEKAVPSHALRNGDSQSCGCLNKEINREICVKRNTTHGRTRTPTYNTWANMMTRCHNPNATAYPKYGAKGISVCERWHSFENFLADMGMRPYPKATIDRIDPKGNYEPSNCRWATQQEQQSNRRNNRLITYKGDTATLEEWSRRTGLDHKTISGRLDKGWPLELALSNDRFFYNRRTKQLETIPSRQ